MTVSDPLRPLKEHAKIPWRFQRTFRTPLHDLDRFVSTIISAEAYLDESYIVLDQIVLEPKHLVRLLASHLLPTALQRGWAVTAKGKEECHELLKAALSDWVDFWYVPTPRVFMIYADHDEYSTFFANTKSSLNRVALPLLEARFKEIRDYQRDSTN